MSLTLSDVKRIAYLSRIAIDDAQAQTMLERLSGIFKLIEQMQAIDASQVPPMSHAQDVSLRLRNDKVTESDQHELFQNTAPQVQDGLYLVPKVIE